MTRDDVMRMAREAGYGWSMTHMHAPMVVRFAELVAAAEREACLKMLDDNWYKSQSDVAAAIRARGNV
jgi:hypothetical protein